MLSLDTYATRKLAELHQRGAAPLAGRNGRARAAPWVLRDGRRMLSFCCNDYLNLSTHPEVVEAAIDATRRFGVGAGASRLVTGNHPLYAELERGWRR